MAANGIPKENGSQTFQKSEFRWQIYCFPPQIDCVLSYLAFRTLGIDFRDRFRHFLIDFRASNSLESTLKFENSYVWSVWRKLPKHLSPNVFQYRCLSRRSKNLIFLDGFCCVLKLKSGFKKVFWVFREPKLCLRCISVPQKCFWGSKTPGNEFWNFQKIEFLNVWC